MFRRIAVTAAAGLVMMGVGLVAGASHNTFDDVPDDHQFFAGVEWAAANGITVGCNSAGTEFCPDSPVTRAQMVTFLRRFEASFDFDLPQPPGGEGAFGPGTWRVGPDIDPGTYRNTGGSGCYWERLSGFSGDFSDIIANEFTSDPTIVTIEASDIGFHSDDCGNWVKS